MPVIVSVLALHGCAHSGSSDVVVPQWLTEFSEFASTRGSRCPSPAGSYWVNGASSNDDFIHTLNELLFEDKLAGYPVEQVRIVELPDGKGLGITGILAGVPLQQFTTVAPRAGECAKKWYLEVSTGEVDATLRTEAILWTAGLIIPLAETNPIYLFGAEDGALVLRVLNRAWILGALMVPFRVENEYWLRFANAGAGASGPPGARHEAHFQ